MEQTPDAAWSRALTVAGVVGLAVFLVIWLAFALSWEPLLHLDARTGATMSDLAARHAHWVGAWSVVSDVFGPVTLRLLAVIVVAVVLTPRARRSPEVVRGATFVLVAVVAGSLVPLTVKWIVARPRPASAAIIAHQSSFPSGHAFGITCTALSALVLLRAWLTGLRLVVALAVAGALVVLVAFARVALNVHYVSDVVAGAGLGVAWTALAAHLVLFRPAGVSAWRPPAGRR